MYSAGDDISAVVVDVGTCTTKSGYAGSDTPHSIFPTSVGVTYTYGKDGMIGSYQKAIGDGQDLDPDVKRTYYTGHNAITYKRPHMDIQSPLSEGLIKDWDAMEHIWSHVFHEQLNINPSENPILLSEPVFNTRQIREKVSEMMFEKFHTPAVFISNNAVLTSFSSCKATSLVVDSGGGVTTVVPVHDGYAIKNAVVKSNLAGNKLTEEYYRILSEKQIKILPYNLIKKQEIKPGEYNVTPIDIPDLTESFKKYHTLETIRDAKESTFRVSTSFLGEDINTVATVPYELPDGNLLEVGSDRFHIPELIFNPTPLNDLEKPATPYQSLQKMIYESVDKSDSDIRKELIANLVVSGGNTLFQGFSDRLYFELGELSHAFGKVKVVTPNATERRYSVWIGGSILGSLGSFQQMWMSKSEWEEFGRPLVEKKCP